MIYHLNDDKPSLHPTCFVAPSADVIGRVTLEAGVSVWFGAVLRGDNDDIVIGEDSNIQDGAVIHVDPGRPCRVGRGCVIGHKAVLHGCTIEDDVLIGIGAVVLNGAHVPGRCLVGAGTLVAEGKQLQPDSLYVGVPARRIRDLTAEEIESIRRNAAGYRQRALNYREACKEASGSIRSDSP